MAEKNNREPEKYELELPYRLWAALDKYAEEHDYCRQTIIAEALRAYLGDAA